MGTNFVFGNGDVGSGGDADDKGHTKSVGSIFIYHFDGINDVSLTFTHLLALRIDDTRMDVDGFKGDIASEIEPEHNHSGDPEKKDVPESIKDRGRIEIFEVTRVGFKSIDWPLAREKPSIEGVSFSIELVDAARLTSSWFSLRNISFTATNTVPSGNADTPNDLTGDVPITNVFQPVEIHFFKALLGENFNFAGFDGGDGGFGEGSGFEKPLVAYERFDNGFTAVADSDDVLVISVDFLNETVLLEICNNSGAGVFNFEAGIFATEVGDFATAVDGRDDW